VHRDDLQDVPVMKRCGLRRRSRRAGVVRRHAHYVTRAPGGHGAARELCELIMHAQGTLEARIAARSTGESAACTWLMQGLTDRYPKMIERLAGAFPFLCSRPWQP